MNWSQRFSTDRYRMGKSIMALSETVKASLRDAQENLKDALAMCSKNRETICK